MTHSVRNKLSVMMFLEFFIWGAWLPLIFGYLGSLQFSSLEQSWILNAFALASFTAMFFSTQFADRNFAAEKFVAFSHLIGGVAILGLAFVTDFWPFFFLMLVHSLFYVPTISITNSIAFANLKDAQRDFGLVRLWGTIGWIAAAWPFVFILVDWDRVPSFGSVGFFDWLGAVLGTPKTGVALQQATTYTFIAAGGASLLLAAFSLVLPHTPPRPAQPGGEALAWLEALKLLRVPFLLVLFIVTFFDAAVHQGFFILTGKFLTSIGVPANWVMPVMSIGQIAEIGTMAVLGACLKRLGWRTTMVIGVLGHALRFGVFALAPVPALAITVNVLHGICYAFYFATVYIFVDEFFPKDARSSAQGLFNFLILGLGPFVGNFVWPYLEGKFTTGGIVDYRSLFLAPAGTALFAALLLIVFFHPPAKASAFPEGHGGDEDDWEPAQRTIPVREAKDPHVQVNPRAPDPNQQGIKKA
jgi:nucleoside transporter